MSGYRSPHRSGSSRPISIRSTSTKAFAVGWRPNSWPRRSRGAFDDLKREGAIKLTQVGSDEKLMPDHHRLQQDLRHHVLPHERHGLRRISRALRGAGASPACWTAPPRLHGGRTGSTQQENERIRTDNRAIREENRTDAERRRAAAAGASGTAARRGTGETGGTATTARGGPATERRAPNDRGPAARLPSSSRVPEST